MGELKAVIFDVDGTLAETERDGHRVAFNRAFLQLGLDWVWDENLYGKLLSVTGGKERIAHYLAAFKPDFSCDSAPDEFIEQIYLMKTRHYVALIKEGRLTLRPGVFRLITELRSCGLRLALATASTTENVIALIQHTMGHDALSWFDCITTSDLISSKKPAPAVFHYCLKQLNLPAESCLVIEDSAVGVKAALAAGIATIATFNNYTEQDDFLGVRAIFDNLGEPSKPCEQRTGIPLRGQYVTVADLKTLHANPI